MVYLRCNVMQGECGELDKMTTDDMCEDWVEMDGGVAGWVFCVV